MRGVRRVGTLGAIVGAATLLAAACGSDSAESSLSNEQIGNIREACASASYRESYPEECERWADDVAVAAPDSAPGPGSREPVGDVTECGDLEEMHTHGVTFRPVNVTTRNVSCERAGEFVRSFELYPTANEAPECLSDGECTFRGYQCSTDNTPRPPRRDHRCTKGRMVVRWQIEFPDDEGPGPAGDDAQPLTAIDAIERISDASGIGPGIPRELIQVVNEGAGSATLAVGPYDGGDTTLVEIGPRASTLAQAGGLSEVGTVRVDSQCRLVTWPAENVVTVSMQGATEPCPSYYGDPRWSRAAAIFASLEG